MFADAIVYAYVTSARQHTHTHEMNDLWVGDERAREREAERSVQHERVIDNILESSEVRSSKVNIQHKNAETERIRKKEKKIVARTLKSAMSCDTMPDHAPYTQTQTRTRTRTHSLPNYILCRDKKRDNKTILDAAASSILSLINLDLFFSRILFACRVLMSLCHRCDGSCCCCWKIRYSCGRSNVRQQLKKRRKYSITEKCLRFEWICEHKLRYLPEWAIFYAKRDERDTHV